MMIDPQLLEYLKKAQEMDASDLHISVASPPVMRIYNTLVRLGDRAKDRLMPPDTERILTSVMNEEYRERLQAEGEVDLAFGIPDLGRFRINVYKQRGSVAGVIRLINSDPPAPDRYGIPQTILDLYEKKSGLVLVTGPTGSGKSTTLATLINLINEKRTAHVITLEDPIEYLYRHKESLVDQREIGLDTRSFATALRAALREDPDVILLGEMRDLETISTALTAAETGHLVFSTLHTMDAASTINRIIDVFPEGQKDQIRIQIAMVLESVVSQRLVPKADGTGRIGVYEVMHCTPAIRTMIRENKTFQIASMIQTGRKQGMISLDDALMEEVSKGRITKEAALEFASDRNGMENKLNVSGKGTAGDKNTAAESGPAENKPAAAPKKSGFRW